MIQEWIDATVLCRGARHERQLGCFFFFLFDQNELLCASERAVYRDARERIDIAHYPVRSFRKDRTVVNKVAVLVPSDNL